jgi:hypothetical protein
MKKIFYILSMFLYFLPVFSQDCVYTTKEYDSTQINKKLENQTIFNFYKKENNLTESLIFSLEKRDTSYVLDLIYVRADFDNYLYRFIRNASYITFILDNNTEIKLKYNTFGNVFGVNETYVIMNKLYWFHYIRGYFTITKEQLDALKTKKIIYISIYFHFNAIQNLIPDKITNYPNRYCFVIEGDESINPQEYFIKNIFCIE